MSRAATDLSAKRGGCLPDAGKSLDFNIVLSEKDGVFISKKVTRVCSY